MKMIQMLFRAFVALPDFFKGALLGRLQSNSSRLALALRKKINGTACFIDTGVVISNSKNFRAGVEDAIYHGCYILNENGKLVMGDRSHLGAYCYINVCHGRVFIGDDVAIGPGTKIIAYSNHFQKGKKITETKIISDVVIGNNVFIGANCCVLPGTLIHDNVVVGAGAVIKGELKSNAIYGGIPCRIIRYGWYE